MRRDQTPEERLAALELALARARDEIARLTDANARGLLEQRRLALRIQELGTALRKKHEDFLDRLDALQAREEETVQLAWERAARSAAEDAEHRMEFLAEASAVLGASLDYATTLQSVVRLAVPRLADWCAVDILGPDGRLERLAAHHVDPDKDALALRIGAGLARVSEPLLDAASVAANGRSQLMSQVDVGRLTLAGEPWASLRDLGLTSFIIVPLAHRDRVLGTVTFVSGHSGRQYSATDLTQAEDLARRAATAIDNARLVRELHETHDQLERQTAELVARGRELEEAMRELQRANREQRRMNLALELKTEEAERARATAEEANRAKGQFLAMMSHELRTPLNAIEGYAELLELEIRGPLTESQRDAIARIRRSQRHLLSLINQVLSFAKLEAGQLRIQLADVPLAATLLNIEPLVHPQLRAKGVHFECRPGDPGLVVRADRERLEQILLNLLSNAIKFTARGGTIVLGAEAVGSEARVRVADTGIGIPPEKLGVIFDPFVQAGARGLAESEGVGLGLAISRDLARAMGGDLSAESTVNAGSTFTLTLPLAQPVVG